MSHRISFASAVLACMLVAAAHARQHEPPAVEGSVIMQQAGPWWLEAQVKGQLILVDPATCEQHAGLDPDTPNGVLSPDGKRIAFIGSDPTRVKDGHDFDLFVGDVDPAQSSGVANARRLTGDHVRTTAPAWLPTSDGLAFLAQRGEDDETEVVWFIGLEHDAKPVRLSDEHAHRAWQVSATPSGEIAFVQLNARKSKEQFSDLILMRVPASTNQTGPKVAPATAGPGQPGDNRRIVLHDQHISSFAFSPDGASLAWSGLGSMFLVNLATGESREIPLHGIHRQLLNHSVFQFAWRPDGKVIAIQCGFLGGIARGLNSDPNQPWPRMFADDKIFFIPADWTPAVESLKVGEGAKFPSPTADDPKAEVSPPAGDESKPWWVRELPERTLAIKWISATQARSRIAATGK